MAAPTKSTEKQGDTSLQTHPSTASQASEDLRQEAAELHAFLSKSGRESRRSTPLRGNTVRSRIHQAPPPAPQKLRRERADDIVECAMRLMDLAMDQNRVIKRLERVIEQNYTDQLENENIAQDIDSAFHYWSGRDVNVRNI